MTNPIEIMFKAAATPVAFAKTYLSHVARVLENIDSDSIASFIKVILDARESGGTIFFIGNGGSAATASHFANDIAIGTRSVNKPFRAVSLTDNVAVITAIANDYSYDDIFLIQLRSQMRKGDVVVAISASGNSKNVIKAVEYANSEMAHTVGLTGFDGGILRQIVKTSIHVPTEKGEYGPVEDAHMVLDHLVGGYLMQLCRAEIDQGLT